MRKGDIRSAYECLNQLSKPKTKAGRTLHDRTAAGYCNQLWSAWLNGSATAHSCCQATPPLLPTSCPPPLPLPRAPPPSYGPYPKPTLDQVVTAIKRLRDNKSPGVCNTLPEMLKYNGNNVCLARHWLILGIWHLQPRSQPWLLLTPASGGRRSLFFSCQSCTNCLQPRMNQSLSG